MSVLLCRVFNDPMRHPVQRWERSYASRTILRSTSRPHFMKPFPPPRHAGWSTRFAWHCAPKHGSWRTLQSELSVLSSQWLEAHVVAPRPLARARPSSVTCLSQTRANIAHLVPSAWSPGLRILSREIRNLFSIEICLRQLCPRTDLLFSHSHSS